MDAQNILAADMSAVGNAMTIRMQKDEVDKLNLLQFISDAGHLLTELHHNQTSARKAFILACLDKKIKTLLEKTDSGKFLFEDSLSDKVNEAKALEKLGKDLKHQEV